MIHALLAAALAAATPPAGAAASGDFTAPRDQPAIMEAVVSPMDDGRFRADLSLRDDAPVWIFLRSNGPVDGGDSWRAGTWEVLTPGVEMVRIGLHEALVASDGANLPRKVAVALAPYEGNLNADYQPAIRLGPDAVALFSDHFLLRPAASVNAVRALGADWTVLPDYDAGHPLARFRGKGWTRDGKPARDIAVTEAEYVLHGDVRTGGSEALVTTIDPALPDWLRTSLERDMPAVLALYAARWGPHENGTPELMVQWGGATPDRVSLGGSVIGSQIVMRLEGASLLDAGGGAGREVRYLIAHEAAHFWLGNLVAYGRPGEAWTSEGGADLAALRALEAVDPDADGRRTARATRMAWRSCAAYLERGPLAAAPERGEQKAFYSCGFLMSLAAERAARARGGDFFTFWSGLIEANRDDGEVSNADWFDAFAALGGSADALAVMRTMLDQGGDARTLEALFSAAGLANPNAAS